MAKNLIHDLGKSSQRTGDALTRKIRTTCRTFVLGMAQSREKSRRLETALGGDDDNRCHHDGSSEPPWPRLIPFTTADTSFKLA
ncbi:hypothetical protein CPLU01_01760 [Colletotrichum plurivorum]|uniref:Uncharacterized protein n=1 Tax=Colletotrichum plurivorum TaxID=2175906 RepID=A0A8H6KYJ1_9PEZI|nr:hypothetical protein CPLU01_01760 [Colletotrichum plurivorum]